MLRVLPFLLLTTSALFARAPALAQTSTAPGLAIAAARANADTQMHALVQALPEGARAKTTGLYVAFDANPNDASALAACDDDGDYVVVITDAMLALIDTLAQAQAADEILHTHKADDYAAFLAKDQLRGARLLPPPPGFFEPSMQNTHITARARVLAREALDGLLAHEAAHVTAGDFTCAHPTATRERGDVEWTHAEVQAAESNAPKIYTASRIITADATAAQTMLAMHDENGDGYAALLAFFGKVPGSAYARAHDAPLGSAAPLRRQVVAHVMAEANASHARATPEPSAEATKNGPTDPSKKH